jgi:hypothetical protein
MVLFDGALGLLLIGLWLFCIIDVITTPEGAVRNLPKIAWLLIVIILVDIGSIAWLVAGRDWSGAPRESLRPNGRGPAPRGTGSRYPEYDRPGRYVPTNPDDDEAFLASLRARAEEQRRRAREAQGDGGEAKHNEDEPPTAQ